MAKLANAAKSDSVWISVNLTSPEAKAAKAALAKSTADGKAAKETLEALAVAGLNLVPPKGLELVFSHRFGLGYAFLPPTEKKAAVKKVSNKPSI